MDQIDYNDKKVLASLGTGKTEGVFQLRKYRNEELHEGIEAGKPGGRDCRNLPVPSGSDGFYSCSISKEKIIRMTITYDCPQLEPILAPTYGCIVYQEQVMQIVRDLAGYTLGRSDLVRRAMSKKKTSVMEKERQNFRLWQ